MAADAADDITNIPPVVVDPPYRQEIRVREGVSIDGYLKRGARKLDDRTVVLQSDDIRDLCV